MTITHRYLGFAACFVLASSGVVAAHAEPAGANQTFLTDYSKLQPFPGKEGKDSLYIAPNVEQRAKAYTHVMVDAPEVFISPESPYKGAKPGRHCGHLSLVRDATVAALKSAATRSSTSPPPTSCTYERRSRTSRSRRRSGHDGLYAGRLCRGHRPQGDAGLHPEVRRARPGAADRSAGQPDRRRARSVRAPARQERGADKQLSFDVLVKATDALDLPRRRHEEGYGLHAVHARRARSAGRPCSSPWTAAPTRTPPRARHGRSGSTW